MGTPGWAGLTIFMARTVQNIRQLLDSCGNTRVLIAGHILDNRATTGDHPSQDCRARTANPNHQTESHA